jgi:capsular exopolysaccharide synthesis family protein
MSDSTTATDANMSAHASTATAGASLGTLTVRDTALAPQQQPPYPPTYGGGDDPLSGGIDYKRVWHSFRRRWLPAVVLGTLLASAASISTWLFMPRGYEAVAWLRVRDKSGMLTGGGRDGGEYEAYRKTQVTLIKSPFVLTSALRRTGIAELPTIREQDEDPVGWLTRSIQVTAPMESEVVQVRLRGEHAPEVAKIVNAVTASYLEDIVNKERAETLGRRDALERKYKENMAEMRERRETFNTLARTLGTRDSSEVATQRSLLLDHLGTLRSQLSQSQRDLTAIDAELAIIDAKARGEIASEDALPEEMVESVLVRDQQIVELGNRLAGIEEAMLFQEQRSARGVNEPAVKRLRAQRDQIAQRIAERRADLRPQIVSQLSLEGTGSRTGQPLESPVVLKMRREMLSLTLAEVSKEFDKVAKEATELGKANADLEARRGEIEQLQRVTDQIGMQLETSSLDLSMPSRVTLIEEASVPEGNDRLFRLMLSMLAGGAALVLGGGSIVALEYLRDRLSTTDEVPRRIGVRMLGSLPRISRSRRNTNDGLLAECVDGIRTLVMQSGRESPRVILVTSAVEHEGKTTFSSQLAASLARSDKRTLLLDGDLRHPNVHLALELELGVGLSELLRGEITGDEAVQPTSIDGLFAVTGGDCDYAAVTALSRPELAKVITSYRESFDYIVIDAGPVLAFADALLLGQQSDIAIVATMRDSSRVPLVNAAIDRLRAVGVRVLGVVMNGVNDAGPRRLYASPLPR